MPAPLDSAIREILLNDWDPQNAARDPGAVGTYDGYIPALRALLLDGPTEDQVVDWLHEQEQMSMCFPSLGTQRLRRVAQRLMGIPRE